MVVIIPFAVLLVGALVWVGMPIVYLFRVNRIVKKYDRSKPNCKHC